MEVEVEVEVGVDVDVEMEVEMHVFAAARDVDITTNHAVFLDPNSGSISTMGDQTVGM